MSAVSESSKLAEFRAETDRDLALLIKNALTVGFLLAAYDASLDRSGVIYRRAAHIYTDAMMLVEKLQDVPERRRLEEKIGHLREALDRRVQVTRQ